MNFGASNTMMIASTIKFGNARAQAYEGDIPMYEEVGDTAFITFDTFYMGLDEFSDYYDPNLVIDPSEFVIHNSSADIAEEPAEEPAETAEEPVEEPVEEEEVDTIKLLLYADSQINRENSPIKNVVIDLSNNGGGMTVAAVFTLGFIMNMPRIMLRDTLTGAESISEYTVDINRDNEYDLGDSMVSHGKKVYVMISPSSFSCANLVAAACKTFQFPLIGQPGSGGSCVILPGCTASGALFQISGTKQISVVRNGAFYNTTRASNRTST